MIYRISKFKMTNKKSLVSAIKKNKIFNHTIEDIPTSVIFNNERTSKNSCLKFDVDWIDGSHTKQAIYQLVDFKNQEINELALPVLKELSTKPPIQNLCWFCINECLEEQCVCQKHLETTKWFFDFIKN